VVDDGELHARHRSGRVDPGSRRWQHPCRDDDPGVAPPLGGCPRRPARPSAVGRPHVRSTLSEETPVPTVEPIPLPGAAGELLTLQRAAERRPGPELAHLVEGSR
jgi:hypothetical protein